MIRVLGFDREPIHATVLERSSGTAEGEVHLRLGDSLPQAYLQLGMAVRIDAPETMLLGEIAAQGAGEECGPVLIVTIRHVLRHLTELNRMRRALLEGTEPQASETESPERRNFWERSRRGTQARNVDRS